MREAPLENWVFVTIILAAGFLVVTCGLKHEVNYLLITVGLATSSFSSLVLSKKFKEWLAKI